VSTDHNFEEKREPKEIRTEVLLLTSLTSRLNQLTVTAVIRLDFITSVSGGKLPLAPPDVHPIVLAVKSSARTPKFLLPGSTGNNPTKNTVRGLLTLMGST